eukprot:SM000021S06503  [mRNA]  locus=s21:716854:717969:- [translate_table: standard]
MGEGGKRIAAAGRRGGGGCPGPTPCTRYSDAPLYKLVDGLFSISTRWRRRRRHGGCGLHSGGGALLFQRQQPQPSQATDRSRRFARVPLAIRRGPHMTPVISEQPPSSRTSSVADGQPPLNSASDRPPTLYLSVKEAGEKVLKNWPDASRQQSPENFRELVLQAIRSILQNVVESCRRDKAPSTGIKIGVENFVAATYAANYACSKVCIHVFVYMC